VPWVEDIPYELTTMDSHFTLSTCFLHTASLSLPAADKMTPVFCAISLAVVSLQIELAFFLPAQLPIGSQHLRKKNCIKCWEHFIQLSLQAMCVFISQVLKHCNCYSALLQPSLLPYHL